MRRRLTTFGAFCYLWLMVGFFTGTLLLVGPVQFVTAELRARGWSERDESLLMMGVIGVYVITSAAISWWLFRRVAACHTRRARMAIPATVTIAAAACLWAWMNPALLARVAGGAGGEVRAGGAEFVFGPYPHRDHLIELKRSGYTAVISLQHPAVLPFEPPGIAEEQRITTEIGLTFIHAPMMPWISANDDALNTIREIARTGTGKYYVHCGLGRDRANVVKRMLEREGRRVATGEGFAAPHTFATRLADGGAPFERGEIKEIEKDVWLIPYPNKHELFGHMLSGQVQHVLLLLNPDDSTERTWLDEGTRLFTQFGVPFSIERLMPNDDVRARALSHRARQLPKPLAIVVPYTQPKGPSQVADTLLRAFTDKSTF